MPDLLNRLAITLAVAFLTMVLSASASAATYVVNMEFDDIAEVGCNSGPEEECFLREAISLANVDLQPSTIEFSVEEVNLDLSLPQITAPLTIDGGTAPGGGPGVTLDGETEGEIGVGLDVAGDETTIEGMAINDFGVAIRLAGDANQVCGSYLGTDASGTVAESNRVGVEVDFHTPFYADNEIGAGCAEGNLISGNDWFGVVDEGEGTVIQGNLIGTDATGTAALGNGSLPVASEPAGGVLAWGPNALIGGINAGEGNTIAFNKAPFAFGAGVVVREPSVAIRGNSIHQNEGFGIFYLNLPSPPVPAPEAAVSVEGGTTVVTGTVEGPFNEDFAIDVFANAACDELTEVGEGERYLGTASVETNGLGVGEFEVIVPVQAQGTVLTATATEVGSGSTSEFSECLVAPKPSPAPPGPPPPPIPSVTTQKALVPENGETLAAEPKSGTIYIKVPGQKKQTKLKEGQLIPVGSVIDATNGKVTLTSVNKAGETQTAVFYGGKFLVAQKDGSGLVVLKLQGGNFSSCKGSARSSGATASGRAGRRLWGSGKGKFRTEGSYGSATVRGTVWLTEDRCGGTFFKTKKGVVSIRDFAAGTNFSLPAGKSYLAKKEG